MSKRLSLSDFAKSCDTDGSVSFGQIVDHIGTNDANELAKVLDRARFESPEVTITHPLVVHGNLLRFEVTADGDKHTLYVFADPDELDEGFGLIVIAPNASRFKRDTSDLNGVGKASITTRFVPADISVESDDLAAVLDLQPGRIRYFFDQHNDFGALDAVRDLLGALAGEDTPVSLLQNNSPELKQGFCDYTCDGTMPSAIGLALASAEIQVLNGINFTPALVLTCDGLDGGSTDVDWLVANLQGQARGMLKINENVEIQARAEFPESYFEASLSADMGLSFSSICQTVGPSLPDDAFGDHFPDDTKYTAQARIFGGFESGLLGVAIELTEQEEANAWQFPVGPLMLDLRQISCEIISVDGALDHLTLAAKLQLNEFDVSLQAMYYAHQEPEDKTGWIFKGSAQRDKSVRLGDTLHALTVGQTNSDWTASLGGGLSVSSIDVEIDSIDGSFEISTMLEATEFGPLLDAHDLEVCSDPPASVMLTVSAAFDLSYCSFELQGQNFLKVGDFAFERVALSINYDGGPHAAVTGDLSATIRIGDALFTAQARKTVEGWSLAASGRIQGTLAEVVDTISNHFFGKDLSDEIGLPANLVEKTLVAAISISGQTQERHLTITTELELEGTAKVELSIEMGPSGGSVKGALIFDGMRFDLAASNSDGVTAMVAEFASAQGVKVKTGQLLEMAAQAAGIEKTNLDLNLEAELHDIMIGVVSPTDGKVHTVVSADLGGRLDLSGFGKLPLVGAMAPNDQQILLSLAPAFANDAWENDNKEKNAALIAALSALRSGEGPALLDDLSGVKINAALTFPGQSAPLALGVPLALGESADGAAKPAEPEEGAPDGGIYWKTLNRTIGPVSIQRVGVGFKAQDADGTGPELDILLDGSLGFGGLELALIGLGAGYHLSTKELNFDLHGLGLAFERGSINISGAFAHVGDDFLGLATVAAEKLTLSASGGFTTIDGAPSMFIYGALNTPLGGPPFFFVEGLAAGFGYNRKLVMPELAQVHDFPFVKQAMGVAAGAPDKVENGGAIESQIRALAHYVQPELGSYFGAVGVKFSSFKLLDSFVLLVLSAGKSTKIDVLGVSTFQNPPKIAVGQTPLAKIDMNIEAHIRPDEGTVLVRAEITNGSYVLSPSVTLTGMFAFASWFKGQHAGDFVLTLGGYNPYFPQPEHYPAASPVTLTYKVPSNDLMIKGTGYFALTPSMIMAGGALVATGKFDGVSVRFALSLDLMIQWAPFHYDARMNVSIHASWHGFSTTATASLHVWGPALSGRAHVKWGIISFDVNFGPARASTPKLLDWAAFENGFLPKEHDEAPVKCLSVTLSAGQIGMRADGKTALVHGQSLEIAIDTPVPFREITGKNVALKEGISFDGAFGCRPCGIATFEKAILEIAVTDTEGEQVSLGFHASVRSKNYAPAMWGSGPYEPGVPGKMDPTVSAGGSATLKLKPDGPPEMGGNCTIESTNMEWDQTSVKLTPAFVAQGVMNQSETTPPRRNDRMRAALGLPIHPDRIAT